MDANDRIIAGCIINQSGKGRTSLELSHTISDRLVKGLREIGYRVDVTRKGHGVVRGDYTTISWDIFDRKALDLLIYGPQTYVNHY